MRTLIAPLAISLTGLSLLGCMGLLQSYPQGLQIICDAPNTCESCAEAVPEMRMRMMAREVSEKLQNAEAMATFEALSYAAPEMKAEILRNEATNNGISQCALADLWVEQDRLMWREGIEQLCAMSTTCGIFDPDDPSTVLACLDELRLTSAVESAVRNLDTANKTALAADLQKLAATHGQTTCALASAVRN